MINNLKSSAIFQKGQRKTKNIRRFLRKFLNDWSMDFSAMLAYNLLIALLPIAVALFGILGLVLKNYPNAEQQMKEKIINSFPSDNTTRSGIEQVMFNHDLLQDEWDTLVSVARSLTLPSISCRKMPDWSWPSVFSLPYSAHLVCSSPWTSAWPSSIVYKNEHFSVRIFWLSEWSFSSLWLFPWCLRRAQHPRFWSVSYREVVVVSEHFSLEWFVLYLLRSSSSKPSIGSFPIRKCPSKSRGVAPWSQLVHLKSSSSCFLCTSDDSWATMPVKQLINSSITFSKESLSFSQIRSRTNRFCCDPSVILLLLRHDSRLGRSNQCFLLWALPTFGGRPRHIHQSDARRTRCRWSTTAPVR